MIAVEPEYIEDYHCRGCKEMPARFPLQGYNEYMELLPID